MILNKRELEYELSRQQDDFITVELDEKEYVIDCVCRRRNYTDSPMSHLCLKIRDGGDGEIRR